MMKAFRRVDAATAAQMGLVDELAQGADDALSLAHQRLREFVRHG